MPNYRRNRVPGGTYFFTVNLRDRTQDLLVRHIDRLREAIRVTRNHLSFQIDSWVVLPDHMHCMWTLPIGDSNFPGRWKAIKARFSASLPLEGNPTPEAAIRGHRGIWQRGYWEHTIRDERDFQRHMDYIHFNPVKHGYVTHPADWPYSTFRRCVESGLYPLDWTGDGSAKFVPDTGERADA